MTELGLLHLLWEEAGLNGWSPALGRARRRWSFVREALDRAAVRIVPARNQTLSDRLAMIGYGDEDGPALLRETARSCGDTWRILLLGIVDDIAVVDWTSRPAVLLTAFRWGSGLSSAGQCSPCLA
jgi:hypothetical protein